MDNLSYTTNQDIIALLCQRLKEYRLAARISQKEMAEKSGVSLTTISHLEQGVNRNITLNNFISLTARPPDGLETDEQVHTQTSKEEQ